MTQKKWHGIVLHHSAGSDTGGCETTRYKEWHTSGRGWLDIGYHAVVEKLEGEYHVVAGRPLNMSGAHCPGKNSDSIGICLAGDFNHDPPDPRQLVVAARYAAGLCAALAIDPSRITGTKTTARQPALDSWMSPASAAWFRPTSRIRPSLTDRRSRRPWQAFEPPGHPHYPHTDACG